MKQPVSYKTGTLLEIYFNFVENFYIAGNLIWKYRFLRMENTRDTQNWLQDLSNQSWNLELVVSGAAIFSTSFLPDLTERGISFYYENYLANDEIAQVVFPTLAYSFAKAASYLLIATFIVHFVLRAFWIALVGLRAVFPEGINYEKLPNTNEKLRERYKKTLGSFDDYIIWLDKVCSQLFSGAFVMVVFSILIAITYILIFVFIVGFKTYNEALFSRVKKYIFYVGGALYVLILLFLFVATRKRFKEHPLIQGIYTRLSIMSTWLYFGLYKPLYFIIFVFASNLPFKKYMKLFLLGAAAFFFVGISIYINKFSEIKGVSLFESRKFYSNGSTPYVLKSNYYDNQRAADEEIYVASIQADVIEDPFVKLFINYTKVLDADLGKVCTPPTLSAKLSKSEKQLLKDKAYLRCFENYFQVSLNDTVPLPTEFLFEEHGLTKTKGVVSYLDADKCKPGRNTLYIKALAIDSLPRKAYITYATIPFWYAKD